MRNNERYLAFSPAVPQAFLEGSDLRSQFFLYTFSTLSLRIRHAPRARAAAADVYRTGSYIEVLNVKVTVF